MRADHLPQPQGDAPVIVERLHLVPVQMREPDVLADQRAVPGIGHRLGQRALPGPGLAAEKMQAGGIIGAWVHAVILPWWGGTSAAPGALEGLRPVT